MSDKDMRCIEKLPSGRYRVRKCFKGRKLKEVLPTYDAALRFREAIEAELATGTVLPGDEVTIKTWGPRWLRLYRSADRDFKSVRSRFDLHIVTASFADLPIGSVEPSDIVEWLRELETKLTGHKYGKREVRPLAYRTRKHCKVLLNCLYQDAITEGLCSSNPVRDVKLRKTEEDDPAGPVPDEWPLRPDEQTGMLQALGDNPEVWVIQFALGTGLRQGEMWNLELRDVHVHVPQPYVYVRFGSPGRPPKGGKTRKVPLFGLGLEAAKKWLAVLPSYAPHNPQKLMFPTPKTEPSGKNGSRGHKGGAKRGKSKTPRAWTDAREAVGRHVWWHLLRHTPATSLLCGWWGRKWTLQEVAKLLGHSSVRTTEMYAHFIDSELVHLAALTDNDWQESGRQRLGLMSEEERSQLN